jgi:hypothetical protein
VLLLLRLRTSADTAVIHVVIDSVVDGQKQSQCCYCELHGCSQNTYCDTDSHASLLQLMLLLLHYRLQQFFDAMPHCADETFGASAKLSDLLI